MKKIYFLILFTASLGLQAQEITSAGFRMGGITGFTIKIQDAAMQGVEIAGGWREGVFTLAGMVQKYRQAGGRIERLFFFTGAGAHAGFISPESGDDNWHGWKDDHRRWYGASPIFGFDFITGIEYHFHSVPLQLGIDYKPYIEFFGFEPVRLDLWDIGISVRYVFNQL